MNRSYTLEQLEESVKQSYSWAETLRNMGLAVSGGSVKSLQEFTFKNNVDTSHFLGLQWAKGKKRPELKSKLKLSDILIKDSKATTQRVKQRLFEEELKKKICEWCKLDKWRGQEISLELDHINGISNDHRLENLRILCPNCHAQTETYRGRNVKRKKLKTEKTIMHKCSCGNTVSRANVSCRKCYLNEVVCKLE